MNSFFGLPSHPLLVHGATVLLPLAAVGGILIAFSKSWRDRIGWLVVAIGGLGVVFTWLAKESGEALEEAVEGGGVSWEVLHRHTQMGETLLTWVIPFFILLVAVMVYDRMKKGAASGRDPIALGIAVLLVVTAGLATYRTIETGHSGAKSVWGNVKVADGEGGEGGERGEGGEGGEEGEGGFGAITLPGHLIGR